MADSDTKKESYKPPAPEELQPKADESAAAPPAGGTSGTAKKPADGHKPAPAGHTPLKRRGTYRPSHKATFIGLALVGLILAVNAVIIGFVLQHGSSNKSSLNTSQVTISSSALNKLGVNTASIGDSGIQLTIGPDTKFNGNVQVAGDTTLAGKLTLNSTFTASSASLTQLQAGNVTADQVSINGAATANSLALRSSLAVAGTTQLQGQVTANQSMTVGGSLSVAGSVLIGGSLQVGTFQTNTLTIGGHVTTVGAAPRVSAGSAVGAYGSVSISGNDEAGTVAVNAGTGAGSGAVATVTFSKSYGSIPHVVVTPIGYGLVVYVSRTAASFTISVSSLTPLSGGNGYAFDYIVEQ